MAELDQLVKEFATQFEAGTSPDPLAWLEKASAGDRQELARRLDAYLMTAPRRAWDAAAYESSPAREAVERAYESLEAPAGTWAELLPALRHAAQLKRSELVSRLASALGVSGREAKVADYYNQMEHGRLPASGVSERVIAALAEIVGASAGQIRSAGERTAALGGSEPPSAAAFARVALPDPDDADVAPTADAERSTESPGDGDEVDELFLGD